MREPDPPREIKSHKEDPESLEPVKERKKLPEISLKPVVRKNDSAKKSRQPSPADSQGKQVADDKHIRLEPKVDPALGRVLADRDKLEKIILNLLFNALKFTPAGGRVSLRAEKQFRSAFDRIFHLLFNFLTLLSRMKWTH